MPTCPHCGATVPEGAVYCGNCGATLNSSMTSSSSTQSQTSEPSTTWNTVNTSSMQARFEKALRRVEILSYVVAGLGVFILIALIFLYLL